ncbi:MAG: hypothetical protein K8H90_09200, partial [Thermoanaerobaculia bacterium]|nr:hypothetical protein [Thermoanaerobaculia bacterium]
MDAWTDYVYYPGAFPVGYDVSRCAPGAAACTGTNRLTKEVVEFDAFGRTYREKRRLPGTAEGWNRRVTLYDNEGRVWRRSEWVLDAVVQPPTDELSLPATIFSDYDPAGRARLITPPDGAEHSVTREYLGQRVAATTRKVALALDLTETAVTTIERYDGQGRLLEVQEQSDPETAAFVATRYGYDEGGRLTRVCQDRTTPSPGVEVCGQERLWAYDNRGFLLSERHPEKGPTGNGFVTYSAYDARGHAGRVQDGSSSRRLLYSFDASERLTKIEIDDGQPAPFPLLKEFTYDSGLGAGNGKLASAFSMNRIQQFSADVGVHEGYSYQGRQGRVSSRQTNITINSGSAESWDQSFAWTPLGQVDSLTYPVCTKGGCGTTSPTPARSVAFEHDDGLLKRVPGFAPGVTYYPNLLVESVAHTNGVTEWITNDPNAIRRPIRFQTTGANIDGDTGNYLYDGSGNIKGIGPE